MNDDTIAFAQELKKRGCDWIDASSGGVSPLQKIPLEPGYQAPFAKAIKEATGLPTVAVGLISDPEHANRLVEQGDADEHEHEHSPDCGHTAVRHDDHVDAGDVVRA